MRPQAIMRVLAFQLARAMEAQSITKVVIAKKLKSSLAQLDRVLDPTNESVTLGLLEGAAQVV